MVQLGENIRINVQLIDGNNSTLWGETYTRPRLAVYELEEALSQEIADALGIQLSGEEEERLTRRYTENSEAHEAYLKGQSEMSKGSYPQAIQYFEKAIEQDPNYAPAYAALAYTYRSAGTGSMPPREVMPKAEEMALKALELDNTLGRAHAVLGDVRRRYTWDWAGAEKEFKLAMELDPSSYEAPYGYSYLMSALGRHDEAIALIRRAQQVDPLNVRTRTGAANVLNWARRYDEALEQSRVALEMAPDYPEVHARLGTYYESMGLYEEAARAWQRTQILEGASEEEVAGLSEAAARGHEGYWRWQLDYLTERARREYVSARFFAMAHAQLGEKDKAFEWLEKLYEERGPLNYLNVDSEYDPLRDDPRFTDLQRRMNLEP
jgi:tetratricopeptide (TPR) repeat protein